MDEKDTFIRRILRCRKEMQQQTQLPVDVPF